MSRTLTLVGLVLAFVFAFSADAGAQARLRNTNPSVKPAEGTGSAATPGIVADPGFEAGTPNPSWTEFSQNFGTPLCTVAICGLGGGTGPHAGTWWNWFGGTTAAETGFVEQSVTIPAGSADLTFWLEIPVTDNVGSMRVKLGSTTIATYTEADSAAFATYQLVTIDIDAFAGGTHMLRFEADNPAGSGVINFFTDDIQIQSVPAGPSLQISPTSIDFGGIQTGTSSSPETVTLTNNGTAAVNISSIATSSTGYSVNLTGTDLSLDPAQSTTFTVTFSPTVVGPHPGTVTITSNAPGSPHSVTLTGRGTNYVTYPSTGGPIAIPDNTPTGITSTIIVPPGAPSVGDLDVDVDVTHTWVGDLTITLIRGATTSAIFDRPGVPASTFGCSGDNLNIIFDDQGTDGSVEGSCTSGNPAYPVADGRYTPDNPLTPFNGGTATGTWTLNVNDQAGGDTGTLNSWALLVTPPVAGEGGPQAGVSALSIAPNPVSTNGQVQVSVATTQNVRVALFDVLGREVSVLFDGAVNASQVAYIALQTDRLAPGAYVVRATGEDFATSQRMTVTR
jgi:subtilisin-like proprotein convertase family protein